MQSLLGHFYSKFEVQEDIATEGLVYILQQSKKARETIESMIKHECGIHTSNISFSSQNSGKNRERPDISGFNDDRKEVIIIEAKFWASLTENQPVEYLKRLNSDGVLIFICPSLRKRSIWNEIINIINSTDYCKGYKIDINDRSIVFKDNVHLIIKTWDEILGLLKTVFIQDNEHNLISDIDQIIGFCEVVDKNSFIPIQQSDLSPKIGKQINSYYKIIGKLDGELKKNQNYRQDKLTLGKPTKEFGYYIYRMMYDFGLYIGLNFGYWSEYSDTPFWLGIKIINGKGPWIITEKLRESCNKAAIQLNINLFENTNKELFIALRPLKNVSEDNVIQDLSRTIIEFIELLKNELDTVNKF